MAKDSNIVHQYFRKESGETMILVKVNPIQYTAAEITVSATGTELREFELDEEFEKELVLSFGLEPEAVDILNFAPGIEFRSAYENAVEETFSGMKIRIIDIHDLIKNKEHLQRKGEKSLLDKYDVEVLKKILKRKEEE